MLRPITNWAELREILDTRSSAIYFCEECGHLWLGSATEPPQRCPHRGCRIWANGVKRSAPGRPFETCPKCGTTNPKRPRQKCWHNPHAFHNSTKGAKR